MVIATYTSPGGLYTGPGVKVIERSFCSNTGPGPLVGYGLVLVGYRLTLMVHRLILMDYRSVLEAQRPILEDYRLVRDFYRAFQVVQMLV